MTLQSPRIYTYKITFEEVPYYYYGMHEEKVYGEEYWGSPVTNKWCWNLYTPKKQILEIFDTRKKAHEIEKRLIKPVLNDRWCINANVGGVLSMEQYKKIGKMTYERKLGIHAFNEEKRKKISQKAGKLNYERKLGVHGRTKEQMTQDGRKSVETHRKNKTGAFDPERRIHKKGGKIGGRLNAESGHLQKISELKYICLETGFISSARGLSSYQRKRNINLSKRRLLSENEYREKTRRLFNVVSAEGKVFVSDDIDKFCKEHNLSKSHFVNLIDGKILSHRGFHLPGTELKFYVEFAIKTPDGKIVRGNNISKFCRDYSTENCNLSVGEMHKLIKGKRKIYKGYALYSPDKDSLETVTEAP